MVSAVLGVVGAGIGAVASSKASKSARKGQDQALAASSAGTAQARGDINRLFGSAQDTRQGAFSSAADFLGGNIGTQIQPFQQGNVAAQQQVQRGLPQTLNAILGQGVDLSGFQARQIGQPSDFNIASPFPQQAQPQPTSGFQLSPDQLQGIQDGLNNFRGGGLGGSLQQRFGRNLQNISR